MKRISFCEGWEFSRDDGAFEKVVIPHDAMLGNRRDADAPAGSASGYFYGASYRYRKSFEFSEAQAAEARFIEFEGVYRDARIEINGTSVDVPPYGFMPFFVNISGIVHAGENSIEVACNNADQPDCRWYSGAGIHRPVWLWEGAASHILPEGVHITTLSTNPATIRIDALTVGGSRLRLSIRKKGLPEGESDDRSLVCFCDKEAISPLTVVGTKNTQAASSDEEALESSNSDSDTDPAASSTKAQAEFDAEAMLVYATWSAELVVPDAELWDTENPHLYEYTADLMGPEADDANSDNDILDSMTERFGIRKLSWDSKGFRVNGRETLLRGGCIHCDNGILGAASFPESETRRIRLLKEAGFNAVRIAHNPAPAALLEACDELGMYVMDETWDMWYTPKSRHDYAQHFLDWCDRDLRRLARRDYNHPSVIMYSVGNEVSDPVAPDGIELERSLVDLLHAVDPTRPVTCGLNLTMMVMERSGRGWYGSASGVSDAANEPGAPRGSLMFNLAAQATGTGMTWLSRAPGADSLVSPALDALDIAGYNYASARYAHDARTHPQRVFVGSETFPHELVRNWQKCESIPNLIGDFMWAAWDYLGEAGAGAWAYTPEEAGFAKPWPWLLAGSGAFDILGTPGAPAALASAVWGAADRPSIQVRPVNRMSGRTYKATWRGTDAIPSWSWHGCDGIRTQIEVYDAHAHSIRLELNGFDAGKARVKDFVAKFQIDYEPGVLDAVSLDEEGRELKRDRLVSATMPLHLGILAEEPTARAGGIAYVAIAIVGANGWIESNADEVLTIDVEGGDLIAFGSAQPAPTESYLDGRFTTYRGLAQAVVRRCEPGTLSLTVQGTSLDAVTAEVHFV